MIAKSTLTGDPICREKPTQRTLHREPYRENSKQRTLQREPYTENSTQRTLQRGPYKENPTQSKKGEPHTKQIFDFHLRISMSISSTLITLYHWEFMIVRVV